MMSVAIHGPRDTAFGGMRYYLSKLHDLASEPGGREDWATRSFAALNGEANRELRRTASIGVRRRFGAFFTGTGLSERLLTRCGTFDSKSVFYDPTCGMGDLLLAAAKLLPLGRTLRQTLRSWGRQLVGTDLHPVFVEGAKARLIILARQRHGAGGIADVSWTNHFPHIRVADGLSERVAFERATHLLMNPPFGIVRAPNGCEWAGGRITEAAVFVITALERVKAGTKVLAILPEVLRSGSFSRHWRNEVSKLAEVRLIEPYGIFDESADVDVFLLRLVRRQANGNHGGASWPLSIQRATTTIADFFDVHVGPVVPHRDRKAGPRCTYIYPRCIPTWSVMKDFTKTRKYQGQVCEPPFVVIRRTSRPGDLYRATATVINGKYPVAVENHLIICKPKDGRLATCMKLMRQLKTVVVNEYLNARIRCRHLTVSAVATIPYKPK